MGLKVYPNFSPRLVLVRAPDVEISMQELHNQLREWEELRQNLSFEEIIYSSGKDYLDESTSVGITLRLLNALVAFESRFTSVASGIVFSGCTPARLADPAASFQTAGVLPGASVINLDDQSATTVLEVVDENILTTFSLKDGIVNNWTAGDHYKIWNETQCNLSGGNLTARDSLNAPLDPIFPTFGTQIIKTSSSSATLLEEENIQYSSFGGGVSIDTVNGIGIDDHSLAGNKEYPVNNIPDAVTIAINRGFGVLYIVGDVTFDSGDDVDGFIIEGQNEVKSYITVNPVASTVGCTFKNASIEGTLSENSLIEKCRISDLNFSGGCICECMLLGKITLTGSNSTQFVKCSDGLPGPGIPEIDCGGSGRDLGIWGYHGGIKILNKTGPGDKVSINLTTGRVVLDSTVTAGEVLVKGVGLLEDYSSGATVDFRGLISVSTVWDVASSLHNIPGTMGALQNTGGTGGTVSVSGFYFVHQNYNYDEADDELDGLIWVQTESGVIYSPVNANIGIYNQSGGLVFSMSDNSADGQGMFHVNKTLAGLSIGEPYTAAASVVISSGLVATGNFALFPGVTISGVSGGTSNPFPNIIEVG